MPTAFQLAAVGVSAVAAIHDLRTGHIPNWLTLGSLSVAVLAHGVLGASDAGFSGLGHGLGTAVFGALACAAIPGLVFLRGGIGGGDVKLFAALGALCSAYQGFVAQSYSFVIALLLAPAYLAYEGKLLRTIANAITVGIDSFRRPEARRPLAPELTTWFRLAPAIFLGTSLMVALAR